MNIIPTPKNVQYKLDDANVLTFAPSIQRNATFHEEIEAFVLYVRKLYMIDVEVAEQASIRIVQEQGMASEAYKIEVDEDAVKIYAGTGIGVNRAFATILQMMRVEEGQVCLPAVTVKDEPDASYRGMMVDLARSWHPFPYLLTYVDICYFYKVAVLHLHFTDDQSYTLPSAAYPKLSTENRFYTREQIQELTEYARVRGVELCPEIDVPGHCKSFEAAYGKLFGERGVICIHEDSMEAMRTLFAELCEMFPYSKYIHIGGDEAYAMQEWTKCPKCTQYAEQIGIKAEAEQFYAHFITEMADVCMSRGKQPIVWEGFAKEVNDRISKDILVMSWENYYQTTPDLLESGFRVINCSWNPMYVVTPRIMWKPEEVFDWSVWKWKAVHPDSPYLQNGYQAPKDACILGGQLLAWGDYVESDFPNVQDGVLEECRCLAERVPMLAENTWNVEKAADYSAFEKRVTCLRAKLEKIIKI